MQPVLSVTSAQLSAWLVAFLWPFVRILALVGTAPVFSETPVPREVKIGLSVLLTLVIAPTVTGLPATPLMSAGGVWIIIQQFLIGAAMGLVMQMVFAAVEAAGDYIGLQMGLSFASFFDAMSGGSTAVLSTLLKSLAMLVFLAVDGHLMMVQTLATSFQTLPISASPLAAGGWHLLVMAGGEVFTAGLMLALPLVTAILTLNLALGILNRASPQLSVFAIGFPLTLLSGVIALQLLMPHMAPFMERQFAASLATMLHLTQALRQ